MAKAKLQPGEFNLTLNDEKAMLLLQCINLMIKQSENSLAAAEKLLPLAKEIENASK